MVLEEKINKNNISIQFEKYRTNINDRNCNCLTSPPPALFGSRCSEDMYSTKSVELCLNSSLTLKLSEQLADKIMCLIRCNKCLFTASLSFSHSMRRLKILPLYRDKGLFNDARVATETCFYALLKCSFQLISSAVNVIFCHLMHLSDRWRQRQVLILLWH